VAAVAAAGLVGLVRTDAGLLKALPAFPLNPSSAGSDASVWAGLLPYAVSCVVVVGFFLVGAEASLEQVCCVKGAEQPFVQANPSSQPQM
jgi:hypothetical protein